MNNACRAIFRIFQVWIDSAICVFLMEHERCRFVVRRMDIDKMDDLDKLGNKEEQEAFREGLKTMKTAADGAMSGEEGNIFQDVMKGAEDFGATKIKGEQQSGLGKTLRQANSDAEEVFVEQIGDKNLTNLKDSLEKNIDGNQGFGARKVREWEDHSLEWMTVGAGKDF